MKRPPVELPFGGAPEQSQIYTISKPCPRTFYSERSREGLRSKVHDQMGGLAVSPESLRVVSFRKVIFRLVKKTGTCSCSRPDAANPAMPQLSGCGGPFSVLSIHAAGRARVQSPVIFRPCRERGHQLFGISEQVPRPRAMPTT